MDEAGCTVSTSHALGGTMIEMKVVMWREHTWHAGGGDHQAGGKPLKVMKAVSYEEEQVQADTQPENK